MEWINGGAHSLCSDVTVSAVEKNLGESRVAEIAADKKLRVAQIITDSMH